MLSARLRLKSAGSCSTYATDRRSSETGKDWTSSPSSNTRPLCAAKTQSPGRTPSHLGSAQRRRRQDLLRRPEEQRSVGPGGRTGAAQGAREWTCPNLKIPPAPRASPQGPSGPKSGKPAPSSQRKPCAFRPSGGSAQPRLSLPHSDNPDKHLQHRTLPRSAVDALVSGGPRRCVEDRRKPRAETPTRRPLPGDGARVFGEVGLGRRGRR